MCCSHGDPWLLLASLQWTVSHQTTLNDLYIMKSVEFPFKLNLANIPSSTVMLIYPTVHMFILMNVHMALWHTAYNSYYSICLLRPAYRCCPKKNYPHFCPFLFFYIIWTWQFSFTLSENFTMIGLIEMLQNYLE